MTLMRLALFWLFALLAPLALSQDDEANTNSGINNFTSDTDDEDGGSDGSGISVDLNFNAEEPAQIYPFFSRRDDLDEGVYWRITGHSSGERRDISAVRFNSDTGAWTSNKPDTSLSLPEKRLAYGLPVRSISDGVVLTCWRNAPDGDDPGRDGCGDGICDLFDECSCTTPAGGNHIRVLTEDNRMILYAHFEEGSVPPSLCPHNDVAVADWTDKSGPMGFNPDIVVPAAQRAIISEGEILGRVGDSGKSSGPHLHIHIAQCDDSLDVENCSVVLAPFTGADIALRPADRDVRENEWSPLNGALPVTTPVTLVRPNPVIDDFQPNPPDAAGLTIAQLSEPDRMLVIVDTINPADPVSAYDWERVEPSLNMLQNAANLSWQMQAMCPSGIARISAETPGGPLEKTFDNAPLSTTEQFVAQSFDATDMEAICIDWAQSVSSDPLCNQAPEMCENQTNFNLIGGQSPGTVNNALRVTLECTDGDTLVVDANPEATLRCRAVPFGFPH